jgi:hypothetical protein
MVIEHAPGCIETNGQHLHLHAAASKDTSRGGEQTVPSSSLLRLAHLEPHPEKIFDEGNFRNLFHRFARLTENL